VSVPPASPPACDVFQAGEGDADLSFLDIPMQPLPDSSDERRRPAGRRLGALARQHRSSICSIRTVDSGESLASEYIELDELPVQKLPRSASGHLHMRSEEDSNSAKRRSMDSLVAFDIVSVAVQLSDWEPDPGESEKDLEAAIKRDLVTEAAEEDFHLLAENEFSPQVEGYVKSMMRWKRAAFAVSFLFFFAGLVIALLWMGSLNSQGQSRWLIAFVSTEAISILISAPIMLLLMALVTAWKQVGSVLNLKF